MSDPWAAGVVVPSLADLGRLPRVQDLMRSWLVRETQIPLLVAQPLSAATQEPHAATFGSPRQAGPGQEQST